MLLWNMQGVRIIRREKDALCSEKPESPDADLAVRESGQRSSSAGKGRQESRFALSVLSIWRAAAEVLNGTGDIAIHLSPFSSTSGLIPRPG